MKKELLLFVAAFLLCISCGDEKKSANSLTPENDSVLVDEPLENQEIAGMVEVINSVAQVLDSIQLQENMIFRMDEATPKEEVVTRLKAFQELLARKQQQINSLTGVNKSNKLAIANLQKMVDFLNKQLEEKSTRISELEDLVNKKDISISSLRYDVDQLSAESRQLQDQNDEQDKLLNEVFYIVADKKELKELGLIEGGGLSKKRANYAGIDKSKFTKTDMRGLETLVIESKNPQLITEKPASSYTLKKNDDKTTTLTITDAKAFWSASPYLIIQK